jgi:RES domain-containing protein
MIVFRLCKQAYINDLSDRGAELSGGRWNGKGVPALYTAGSRALAVLEIAVHVPYGILPVNYCMITIEVPGVPFEVFSIADLPNDWNRNPFARSTQDLGDDFLKSGKKLLLQIPSASVSSDFNYIINPKHSDFKKLKVVEVEPFEFDSRLFKR